MAATRAPARRTAPQTTASGERRAPHVGLREAAAAALVALVATTALYGPHIADGGWYADDWMLIARLENRTDGLLSAAGDLSYRPGYALLLAAMYAVAGTGQAAYLCIGAVFVGAQAFLLYLCLRRLGTGTAVAVAAGLILLATPFVDGARLWMSAFASSAAVALTFGGLLLALRGLDEPRRSAAVRWHAGALVVWFAAVLTYEAVAPLIACAGLAYLARAGVRRATLVRWAADLVVLAIAAVVLRQRGNSARASDFTPEYLWLHFRQSWTAAGAVLREHLPAGSFWWGPLGVALLLVAATGIGAALADGRTRRDARQALVLTWGGLALAIAGYAAILPAGGYFIPNDSGAVSRVLVASAPGLALFVTGVAATLAVGLTRAVGRSAWRGAAFAVAAGALVTSYVVHERDHQRSWADAWVLQQRVVAAAQRTIDGPLRPGDAVVTFRHAFALPPGDVPVFATWWDLRGALELRFRTHDLRAVPWTPQYTCERDGMAFNYPPGTLDDPPSIGRYGRLWFVDPVAYRSTVVRSQPMCQRLVSELSSSAPLTP